jgi:anti-anti-sigma regulatory factor
VTPLTGRVGLRLVGEIDLLNADVLAQAIAMLPPKPPEIHFQLSGLEFIDLQGTRELIKLAIVPKRLVLRHPPPTLLRIITLVWPDVREQIVTATTRPGMPPSPVERLESPE